MASKPNTTPIRKVPLFTPYVVVWSMFGMLSFGLLAVLGLAPEWLDDLRPAATFADPQGNQGQRAAARLAADIEELKSSVGQMQLDLAKVKTDLVTQVEQQKTVSTEMAALQSRLMPATTPDAAPAANVAPAATPSRDASTVDTTVTDTKSIDTKPEAAPATKPETSAAKPRVINADAGKASDALETGSLNKPQANPVTFGPATVKPAPVEKLGIKISTAASVDSLRLSWELLSELHADKLGKLQPRYRANANPTNPGYDLIAGPLKSQSEAAKVCKSFTDIGMSCSVNTFGGNAL